MYIMKKSDFIYSSVPGDGACFFHSIAFILTIEGPNQVKKNETLAQTDKRRDKLARKLRRECVGWLEQNLDYTIPQLGRTIGQEIQEEVDNCIATNNCNKYKTIPEYLTYMGKHKSYAGQIEIYALSHKFGRSIRVFTEDKGKYKTSGLGFMIGLNPDPMDDIHIFHNSGNKNLKPNEYHFDALFPKKKATSKKKTSKKKTSSKKKTTSKKKKKTTSKKKTTRKKTTRKKTTRKKTTRKKQQTKRKKPVSRRGSKRVRDITARSI